MFSRAKQPVALARRERPLVVGLIAAGLLLPCLHGCAGQSAGHDERVPPAEPRNAVDSSAEATLLLLADGPLTSRPTPADPTPDEAGSEFILNSQIVPEVSIQSGLIMQPVHTDAATGYSFSIVTWPESATLRRHWHPSTERLWMIEGLIASPADGEVGHGKFWEAPARVEMGPFTSTGSTFAFLGEGPFETYYLDEGEQAPEVGETRTVDPGTMAWKPLADVAGGLAEGEVKMLSARTQTDRGVYLVRLPASTTTREANDGSPYTRFGANIEGYVLQGELRYSDPYHGTHLLKPGYYFRIPAGFPSTVLTASG